MTKIRYEPIVLDTLAWIAGGRFFAESLDIALSESGEREQKAIARIAKDEGWDDEEYMIASNELNSRFWQWMPALGTYATVVFLYSLVETQLLACAERVRKDKNLAFGAEDLRGSTIERGRVYFMKAAGVRLEEDPAWSELKNLQALRNIIVHRRGGRHTTEDSRRLLARYGAALSVASDLNASGELRVSTDLCRHFIREVDGFFRRLFSVTGLPERGVTFE